jgi:hypothetical protein
VTSKTVTTVTEYFWHFDVEYSLTAYVGNTPDDRVLLQQHKGRVSLMTGADSTPKPPVSVVSPIEVNITWMLQQLDNPADGNFTFGACKCDFSWSFVSVFIVRVTAVIIKIIIIILPLPSHSRRPFGENMPHAAPQRAD